MLPLFERTPKVRRPLLVAMLAEALFVVVPVTRIWAAEEETEPELVRSLSKRMLPLVEVTEVPELMVAPAPKTLRLFAPRLTWFEPVTKKPLLTVVLSKNIIATPPVLEMRRLFHQALTPEEVAALSPEKTTVPSVIFIVSELYKSAVMSKVPEPRFRVPPVLLKTLTVLVTLPELTLMVPVFVSVAPVVEAMPALTVTVPLLVKPPVKVRRPLFVETVPLLVVSPVTRT